MRRNMWVVLAASVIAAVVIFIGCEGPEGPAGPAGPAGPSVPVINTVHADPFTCSAEDTVQIEVEYTYEGTGTITINWSADYGTISTTTDSTTINWIAPSSGGWYVVDVDVSDGIYTAHGHVTIEVSSDTIEIPENDEGTVTLQSGSLNGINVEDNSLEISVPIGENISGTITVETEAYVVSSHVLPLITVWSWGSHSTSYQEDYGDIVTSPHDYDITIDLAAPSSTGTYYITIAFNSEYTGAQIASLTHWSDGEPIWDDGKDIADWGNAEYIQSLSENAVYAEASSHTVDNRMDWVPAAMIKVTVTE